MPTTQTRRRFLTTLSVTGAAGLVPAPVLAADGPPETATVRFIKTPNICPAPQYVAEALLHAEGITDIRYVDTMAPLAMPEAIARGKIDFGTIYSPVFIAAIDAGEPFTMLAGLHAGCFELFGNESVRSIADLRGKSVAIGPLRGP